MAQKTVLIDDIDGSVGAETITFAVDGVVYEIDLNAENAAELRQSFTDWTDHARVTSRPRGTARANTTRNNARSDRAANAEENQRIREWANANGYQVSDRGRFSIEVLAAYRAAHA